MIYADNVSLDGLRLLPDGLFCKSKLLNTLWN